MQEELVLWNSLFNVHYWKAKFEKSQKKRHLGSNDVSKYALVWKDSFVFIDIHGVYIE